MLDKGWEEKMNKAISYLDVSSNLERIQLIEEWAEDEEKKEETKNQIQKDEWKRKKRQGVYFLAMISLVPFSVFLWNVHPVLGLVSIASFLWMLRNKIITGYYFGE